MADGWWRPLPHAEERRVRVSLGEATLTLAEVDGEPLAHWSLPAIERVSDDPPRYAPHEEAEEGLRVDDAEMVEAIERVRRAVRRRPKAPRIRRVVLALAALAAVVLAWRTGLDPVYRAAAANLPAPVLANLDDALMDRIAGRAGAPCDGQPGAKALGALAESVLGPDRRAAVLPDWSGAAELPGGLVVVGRDAVEGVDDPIAAAGWLIAAEIEEGPATRFLSHAGPAAAFRLMSTGAAPDAALDAYAEAILAAPDLPDAETLAARFEAAGLSATPFARASGDAVLAALDPYPVGGAAPLGDAGWIALRDICT